LIDFGVPIFGIASCVIWFISLVRVRYLRNRIEQRIKELEKYYGEGCELSLRIRNGVDGNSGGIRQWPVSILMRIFPITLGIIWVAMLGYEVYIA
jgi:hypothetical protein